MATISHMRRFSLTGQVIALVSVLLLSLNIVLGYTLASQSMRSMKTLIQQRMLDISNTAAAMLDGDALAGLSANDANTPAYQDAMTTLRYFQDNIDLSYIYCIQRLDDGTFAFSIDPTVEDPGTFGDQIVDTKALEQAARGIAAVDDEAYADAWGKFYSAYSPVFDSNGKVVSIVAVDFDADWFDEQVAAQVRTAVVVGLISLTVGALVVMVIMSRYRNRFKSVYRELESLAADVEGLTTEVIGLHEATDVTEAHPAQPEPASSNPTASDIDAIGGKIRSMQATLRTHIERIQQQAYSDALTGVGNKAAYAEEVERISARIADGTASFIVAVFDINGLKQVNDTLGHDEGDWVIVDAASSIVEAFGRDRVYRIGGDEFIVIVENMSCEEMVDRLATFEQVLSEKSRNADRESIDVSVSKGWCSYQPPETEDYQSVFRLADLAMYDDKAAFYRAHANQKRRPQT